MSQYPPEAPDPPPVDPSGPPPPPLPSVGEPYVPQYLGYSSVVFRPYESARPRARTLVRLLCALVVLHVMMLWPSIEDLSELRQARARGDTSHVFADDETISSPTDVVFLVLGFVQSVVWVLVIVYWMMWVHRTYRNLGPLRAEGLSTTPGWAVGYNFIPVVNLYKPFLVMLETWRASDPTHAGGTDWRSLPAPRIVLAWWALFVLSVLIAVGALIAIGVASASAVWASAAATATTAAPAASPAILDAFYGATWAMLVAMVLDVVVYVLEIFIVNDLTDLQEARGHLVEQPPDGAR